MARNVDVQVQADQAEQLPQQLLQRTETIEQAYAAIGRVLVNRIRLCFRASRSPWGVPWLPIKFRAPKVQQVQGKYGSYLPKIGKDGKLVLTAAGKKQQAANAAALSGKGAAGKPLVDTGLLRNSITYNTDSDGVEIGTVLKQAKLQHFGGRVVPKRAKALAFPGPGGELIISRGVTIPARPFMPINPQGQVALPPAWNKSGLAEIQRHFGVLA
jgi:phage gpG-like protein